MLERKSRWGIRPTVRALALLVTIPLVGLVATGAASAAPAPAHTTSYSPLQADWWQWVVASPAATNPTTDPTGANCGRHQQGGVWFLAGVNGGGSANRTCRMPAGKSVFFPVSNFFSCGNPGSNATYQSQLTAARQGERGVNGLTTTFDGRSISAKDIRYTESRSFSLNVGKNNVFGAPAGTYRPCADVGYYVMLPKLSVGTHHLHFTALKNGQFAQDVKYTLIVQQ